MIFKIRKLTTFSITTFFLLYPISNLAGEQEDLYWWANAYGQYEIVCMQYRTDNISKNIAIKFFKIITSTRKNKFYNKENYKGLIKQFYNPKENLYVCKDLYEASIE